MQSSDTFRRHKIKPPSHFRFDLFLFCQCYFSEPKCFTCRGFSNTPFDSQLLFQTADIFMPIEKCFEWSPSQVIWEQAGCAQVTDFLQLNSREFLADRPPAEQTSSAVTCWTHHANPPTKLELPMIFVASRFQDFKFILIRVYSLGKFAAMAYLWPAGFRYFYCHTNTCIRHTQNGQTNIAAWTHHAHSPTKITLPPMASKFQLCLMRKSQFFNTSVTQAPADMQKQ